MLIFSITRRVAGLSRTPKETEKLQALALHKSQACIFCGYASPLNTVVFRDNNPLNTEPDNLGVADPLCLAWQQLDTVTAETGVVVYLPTLPPQDANHLQRAIAKALESEDDEYRKDAKALLDWLTTHDKPVKQLWGTQHPQAFAQALKQLPDDQRQTMVSRFRHLALALHPGRVKSRLNNTGLDESTTWWQHLYRDYCSRS